MLSTFAVALLLLLCGLCLGQSSYKGLTPGTSTRSDVGRVLGQPIKELSKTLVEYKSPDEAARLYVQYSDESPAAIVERIELACLTDRDGTYNQCFELGQLGGVLNDAFSVTTKPDGSAHRVEYYSAPRLIVVTRIIKGLKFEVRMAFYSKELYESVVPKGGCTGTIFGTWQTDRGRMTVVKVGDSGIQGTYAKNNGSFSLKQVRGGYMGEWKDNTGSGTMALMFDNPSKNSFKNSFRASLSRGTATSMSPKQPPARSEAGAKLQSVIDAIKKSGGAAVGETIESSEPELGPITGLPPGEPLTGKCVP